MVLCYSRLLYIEFTRGEKFEDFIRCHQNAFRFLRLVPIECWYDNLTSAVSERLSSLVKFNARFMAIWAVTASCLTPVTRHEEMRKAVSKMV